MLAMHGGLTVPETSTCIPQQLQCVVQSAFLPCISAVLHASGMAQSFDDLCTLTCSCFSLQESNGQYSLTGAFLSSAAPLPELPGSTQDYACTHAAHVDDDCLKQ